jgi:hypothetical protein
MKRIIAVVLICALSAGEVWAIGRDKAAYVGGTIASLNQHKKALEGELDLSGDRACVLKLGGQSIEVPYDRITAVEYQKSSHLRVGLAAGTVGAGYLSLAIATSMATFALFPAALMVLPFANKKKKRHFLTVAYKDADDQPQVMVLELGKNIEKVARAVIPTRSGKEIKVVVDDK